MVSIHDILAPKVAPWDEEPVAAIGPEPGPNPAEPEERCWHRCDWIDESTVNRPGWIRTTCKACGGFVGYRPTDTKSYPSDS